MNGIIRTAIAFLFFLVCMPAQADRPLVPSGSKPAGTLTYNANHHQFQYCGGTDWIGQVQGGEDHPQAALSSLSTDLTSPAPAVVIDRSGIVFRSGDSLIVPAMPGGAALEGPAAGSQGAPLPPPSYREAVP